MNIQMNFLKTAKEFAHSNGILKIHNGLLSTLSCTLYPSPFPACELEFAKSLQQDFNVLYHRVARDHDFLTVVLTPVLPYDDYLAKLWEIYQYARKENCLQAHYLGLNRSDYMLHIPENSSNSVWKEANSSVFACHQKAALSPLLTSADIPGSHQDSNIRLTSLRQVEFNLMASSFCGLAQRMVQQHRVCLALTGQLADEDLLRQRVPECNTSNNFADGLAQAHHLYTIEVAPVRKLVNHVGEHQSPLPSAAILMIVSDCETNVYDQRALMESLLLRHPSIPVLIRSFNALCSDLDRMVVDAERRLFVDGTEIAVVYFRYGYSPTHFPNEAIWDVKKALECSLAIKCPSIQYMLANTKLVQAALTRPNQLARFIDPSNPAYNRIMATFAKQYPLGDVSAIGIDAAEVDAVIKECLHNPHLYVMKPQREGGGNNYFDDQLVKQLEEIKAHNSGHAFVLMERLFPFPVDNLVLDATTDQHKPRGPEKLVGELGIFGAFIARRDTVLLNEASGHLLRSKPFASNEGGIAAGYGCLDSPFLI